MNAPSTTPPHPRTPAERAAVVRLIAERLRLRDTTQKETP